MKRKRVEKLTTTFNTNNNGDGGPETEWSDDTGPSPPKRHFTDSDRQAIVSELTEMVVAAQTNSELRELLKMSWTETLNNGFLKAALRDFWQTGDCEPTIPMTVMLPHNGPYSQFLVPTGFHGPDIRDRLRGVQLFTLNAQVVDSVPNQHISKIQVHDVKVKYRGGRGWLVTITAFEPVPLASGDACPT